MIARVVEKHWTAEVFLDYNEKKAARGVARLVAFQGLPGDSVFDVYNTFEERESLPNISAMTRKKAIHLTVDPGITDAVAHDETKMISMMIDMMQELGFENQPMVIYRHKDIDRQHYHIVASCIREDGKVVCDSFIGRKIKAYMLRNETKYGYTFGKDKTQVAQQDIQHVEYFDYTKGSTIPQLRAILNEALTYNFVTPKQFAAVCESRGMKIKIRKRQRSDGYVMMVQGMNENKKAGTTLYNTERNLKIRAVDRLINTVKKNEFNREARIADCMDRVGEITTFCAEVAQSQWQFERLLAPYGIVPVFTYEEGDRKKSSFRNAFIVSRDGKAVFELKEFQSVQLASPKPLDVTLTEAKARWTSKPVVAAEQTDAQPALTYSQKDELSDRLIKAMARRNQKLLKKRSVEIQEKQGIKRKR